MPGEGRGPDGGTFDYVIVGAGPAGCVLANRLTEDGNSTVCLLEAGPPDIHPYMKVPSGFIKIIFNPKYTWQFKTEPTELTNGRAISVLQGRTLGGSSSINGLVYNRGQKEDYDDWEAQGNKGWNYESILPYFKRSERWLGKGDDDYHGRDGTGSVTNLEWIHPVCEAFIGGAGELGIPRNRDYNGANQEGVGYFQRIIEGRWRVSAATAFLKPARSRSNLEVRTRARSERIVFEDNRAVAVRYVSDGDRSTRREVRARREIILCSGTVNTPRLLQLSGVGPAGLLKELGVPVVKDLAGVGENFRDHYSCRIVARARNVKTVNEIARWPRLGLQVARWAMGWPSVLTLSPSLVHIFCKSRDGVERPDLQGVFTPASYKAGFVSLLDDYPGMTCGFWPHRPKSAGFIRAQSTNVFEDPLIQPNYLSDPEDQRVLLDGVRLARKLVRTSKMAQYFESEQMPGPGVEKDDELLDYVKQYGTSSWHLVGTARMGPETDPTAVVDDQLRVYGVEGLRIADASVMPMSPSGNTYAPTVMVAEKAADMIRGRPPLEPIAIGGDQRQGDHRSSRTSTPV